MCKGGQSPASIFSPIDLNRLNHVLSSEASFPALQLYLLRPTLMQLKNVKLFGC